jgi:hypothetical protein
MRTGIYKYVLLEQGILACNPYPAWLPAEKQQKKFFLPKRQTVNKSYQKLSFLNNPDHEKTCRINNSKQRCNDSKHKNDKR